LPLWEKSDDKYTAAKATALVFLGFGFGAPIWGWLSDRIKSRKKILWIGSYLAASAFLIILLLPNLPREFIYILLFLCGFFASVEVLIFAMANDVVSAEMNATAISFVNMLVMSSGFILQPIIGMLLDYLALFYMNTTTMLQYTPMHYRIALSILPLGLIIAGTTGLFLEETHKKAQAIPKQT